MGHKRLLRPQNSLKVKTFKIILGIFLKTQLSLFLSISIDKGLIRDSKRPVGDLWSPIGDTRSPIGDSKCPIGNSKSPIADSRSPIGDLKNPIGTQFYRLIQGILFETDGDPFQTLGALLGSPRADSVLFKTHEVLSGTQGTLWGT